ncbi:hypothetical protein PIB30_018503 [Stylosanthes scabra]|uniref:Uncharacterized protein n=1 Tax=Stylosanthes scabra TaxID=79078 RepID=A0ABU6X5G0_9FABA|nr:hypothetical protein [Stylosanthes scabra]
MTGVQGAWKRYKTRIKKKHFEPYLGNIENMLANRPLEILEVQFRKLIAYWSIPAVKAMCVVNSENRKKQKWRHKMGPINFANVRVDLDKLTYFQEARETPTDAFQKVFGKENPGRVRCFERTVTKISLKKNKEINEIKKQSEDKVASLKTEVHDYKQRVEGLEDLVRLLLQQNSPDMNIDEALSLLHPNNHLQIVHKIQI